MFSINDDGPVRWLMIDNPARRNAIPAGEWGTLADLLQEFGTSDQRTLVITGSGGDFCSGADLAAGFSLEGGATMAYEAMRPLCRAARSLYELDKPTVAAVDGVAVGAGMNLALGCDIVIASSRARFSEIFVRRGLVVDFGGLWLLPRRIGLARAKELALTGRVLEAEDALRYGLAAEVVAPEDLRRRAAEVAAELAAAAPQAQHIVKLGLDHAFEMSFDEALEYEAQAQAKCLTSEDVIEGVAAFLEKRPPQFKGR